MEFYYDEVDENVLILSVDGGLMADNSHRLVGELERYIDLGIDRFVYGRLELGDLRFAGSFREGFLPDSTFGLRLGRAGGKNGISAQSIGRLHAESRFRR